jgi:hypothetical protein
MYKYYNSLSCKIKVEFFLLKTKSLFDDDKKMQYFSFSEIFSRT